MSVNPNTQTTSDTTAPAPPQPEPRTATAHLPAPAAPVVLDKQPSSWHVLWHTDSPHTGQHWADLPVHSVVGTAEFLAGRDRRVAEQELAERGLSHYDIPDAVSAGDALERARARWEAEGPHAAWFAFIAEDAELIESVRAQFQPTPEQEQAAFATLQAAFAAYPAPAVTLTLEEADAIVSGRD
ncbi:hypothetical protein [Streptomyces sp. NPDC097619]|uniref:hypothetical protein n=1 Tax=Streptomyces sp. NPDC097619 TaxID=3157228 RepID=UPI00332EB5C5